MGQSISFGPCLRSIKEESWPTELHCYTELNSWEDSITLVLENLDYKAELSFLGPFPSCFQDIKGQSHQNITFKTMIFPEINKKLLQYGPQSIIAVTAHSALISSAGTLEKAEWAFFLCVLSTAFTWSWNVSFVKNLCLNPLIFWNLNQCYYLCTN